MFLHVVSYVIKIDLYLNNIIKAPWVHEEVETIEITTIFANVYVHIFNWLRATSLLWYQSW